MLNNDQNIAIVVSLFNSKITTALLDSTYETLMARGVPKERVDLIKVPGAFEIPVTCAKLARKEHHSCVIALGCLIRGETPHFDYISQEVSRALMEIGLETEKPIIMGVLTTNTEQQALDRCHLGQKREQTSHIKLEAADKGVEFAEAALAMLDIFKGDLFEKRNLKDGGPRNIR